MKITKQHKINIRLERPADNKKIDELCKSAFGPGRLVRSAYRYREKTSHIIEISHVLIIDNLIIGSVRYWKIIINGQSGLLLGPVVVDPEYRGNGYGHKLLDFSINNCINNGYKLILLVGDFDYYAQLGFKRFKGQELDFIGPVNKNRILYIDNDNVLRKKAKKVLIKKYIK